LACLELDELRLVPAAASPLKAAPRADARQRRAMLEAWLAEAPPQVVMDPLELDRPGPSYTVDTLTELRREMPTAQLWLIIGEDQAAALPGWHRWREIAEFATICVAARAGFARARGTFDALNLGSSPIQTIELPPMDVSATDIRERLANHQTVAPLVFEPVARYIAHHHLYQTA